MLTNDYIQINEGGLSNPSSINLKTFGIDDLQKVDFKDRPERIIFALDDFLDWSKSSWEDLECCDIIVKRSGGDIFLELIPFQTDNGTRGIETRQAIDNDFTKVFTRYFLLVDEDIIKADPTAKKFYEVSEEYIEYSFNLF